LIRVRIIKQRNPYAGQQDIFLINQKYKQSRRVQSDGLMKWKRWQSILAGNRSIDPRFSLMGLLNVHGPPRHLKKTANHLENKVHERRE
jgi:hypothetical protein